MGKEILSMTGINKSFAGVHALKNVDFSLQQGEIHALVGENGAGKSTLMNVLTGIHPKDSGEIHYFGRMFNPRGPKHALELGIGIIHQELNMMYHLTVAQNIFIGREFTKFNGLILDEKKLNQETEKLFKRLNMNIDPAETMANLSVGKQQMVEIARAVSHDLRILILDEPTAALSNTEIQDLFAIMRDLASKQVGLIHISHRLEEVNEIAERVTVLRDGENAGTERTDDVKQQDIINMMVGRVIYEEPKQQSAVPEDAETVLSVRNLQAGPMVRDVSFDLRKGEILGFAGLIGAGRTETARAIFGADRVLSGKIRVSGRPVQIRSPEDAVRHGIGYLSEDRKRFGLATKMTVVDNLALASLEFFQKGLFLNAKKVEGESEQFIERLSIKTPSVHQLVKNLSGGNQQKVVIAKWLIRNCDILIFDEPTRGIDVGAKSEIYTLMNELVKEGKSIIMISSELPEILRMSDRIVVMCEGRITGELSIEDATQEEIIKYATMRENATGEYAYESTET